MYYALGAGELFDISVKSEFVETLVGTRFGGGKNEVTKNPQAVQIYFSWFCRLRRALETDMAGGFYC